MASLTHKAPWVRYLVVAMVLLVAAVGIYVLAGGGTKSGIAYFKTAKNVYPGDGIRILGMQVGKIDKISTEGDKVKVDFHYDSKYSLPATVNAAILSPTLVATRFIQLDPAYTSGPALPDGGSIPVSRTAVPVEFDELKKQLDQVSDALGPNGANKEGALNRALETINKNGAGQGQNFHDMITELSKASKTLSDGRGDLFGTVNNLAHFSSVLTQYDSQIVEFDHRLADVSGILNDNSEQLRELLPKVDDAGHQVDLFLKDHGDQLTETVDRAGSISRSLAKQRDNIAGLLHIAPNTVTNFASLMNPRTGTLDASVAVNNTATLGSPGGDICALITTVASANELEGQRMCVQYLGPIFRHLAMESPPVGAAPVVVPYGSSPKYGSIDDNPFNHPGVNTNPSPNGSNSDLPPSSSLNGNDHKYSDPIPALPIPGGGK
jgi:phospholipid/cholesterol/gamma-HCH transport system substrate-binding protein